MMRRLPGFVLVLMMAMTAFPPSFTMAAAPRDSITIESIVTRRVQFSPTLKHNIADLVVGGNGQRLNADFLTVFAQTGGLERWGYPTSEIFQEEPGNLVQYYQRGVLDWHWRADMQTYVLERRLAWDYFGGDRAGAGFDQGTEAAAVAGSDAVGPWGHTVSNVAVDGTETGFADFFNTYGGVRSFGFPKTEARIDTGAGLHIAAATNGFIRQYFQAGVLEYHPESAAAPVELRLLGDDLRDKTYAGGSWQSNTAFQPARTEGDGQFLPLVSLAGTPVVTPRFAVTLDPLSVQQGRSVAVHVAASPGQTLHGYLDGSPAFELTSLSSGYWGILGVDAWSEPGSHTVRIDAEGANGRSVPIAQATVQVVSTVFPTEDVLTLPPSKGDIVQRNVQIAENDEMRPIFTAFTPQKLWEGVFLRPTQGRVTDAFGTKRTPDGGKTFTTYHEGLDLGDWMGTPVKAANTGRVALARPLHVRGNGVVIDHGMGIFTGYYHMSRLAVQEGNVVHKGDIIGYVGETGYATGPHLHFEVRVDNQYVDPNEWLVRDVQP